MRSCESLVCVRIDPKGEDDLFIYRLSRITGLIVLLFLPWVVYDKRNEIPVASLGDKSYQVPEYSLDFHKQGSTRPVVNFG